MKDIPPIPVFADILAYASFDKDCEDAGLEAPSFTQYLKRPDYYESWLKMAQDPRLKLSASQRYKTAASCAAE